MADKILSVTGAQIEESVAKKHTHSNSSTLDGITSAKVTEWNNKLSSLPGHRHDASEIDNLPSGGGTADSVAWSNVTGKPSTYPPATHSHSYTELTNKPTIPSKTSELTNDSTFASESFVTNKIAEAQLGGGEVDLSGLATKDELNLKADKTHNHDSSYAATGHNHSGAYEPVIATKGTAFNKSFGSVSGTVSEGNHTHTGYAASNHTHSEYGSATQVATNTSDIADITQQIPENLKATLADILIRLGVLEGYHKTKVNTVPILYLTGDMTGMTDSVKKTLGVKLVDIYNDIIFEKNGDFKWQGASSLTYPKKNYSVSIKNVEDSTSYSHLFDVGYNDKCNYVFENWIANNGFHLKANYQDYTMVRNVVGSNLGKECCKANYPNGRIVVDGFPIVIYLNDVFLGCYTFNMKQDGAIFGFDSTNTNHIAYRISDVLGSADESWAMSNMDYRANGSNTAETQAKLQRLIDFIRTSTDEEFKANYSQYIDLQSFIDYWLFIDLGSASDSTMNNITYATWDGQIWYACHYDMDICYGAYGHSINSSTNNMRTLADGRFNPIWGKIERCFWDELVARYNELKTNGKFNATYIYNKFKNYQDKWGTSFLQQERTLWSARPNNNEDVDYIQTWLNDRFTFLNAKYTTTANIPVQSISLNKINSTLQVGSTEQLTVSFTPTDATNKVVIWSSNDETKATVISGIVTAKAEGNVTITATSVDGNKVATCTYAITQASSDTEPISDTNIINTLLSSQGSGGTVWTAQKGLNTSLVNFTGSEWQSDGLKFNGTTQYGNMPEQYKFSNKTCSYEFYIKPTNTTTRRIIFTGDTGMMIMLSEGLTDRNKVTVNLKNNNSDNFIISTNEYTPNEFIHIIFTYNSTSKIGKLYIDGEVVSNSTLSSYIAGSIDFATLGAFSGGTARNDDSYYKKVALYNIELTEKQVRYLFQNK